MLHSFVAVRFHIRNQGIFIHAGLHALRHTFLTEAGRHTQNVKALQKLAGHSRIETTMRYIHPDAADVLEIASAVQQARSGVTTVFTTVDPQEAVDARKM
jgi:integrase